jgi:uncharacterized protein with LGFP repeats
MIIWHPSVGAHWIHGAILQKYRELGSESKVRYPYNEEGPAYNGGKWQGFDNGGGLILWHPTPGAHWVRGAILDRFRAEGSEARVGYPVSEEYPWGSGKRQTFEHAYIYWTPTAGTWIVWFCQSGGSC